MKMKKILWAVLILLFPLSLLAAEEVFLDQLAARLRERDWEEQEISEFVEHAHRFEWETARGADPEVVAFALSFARERGQLPEADGQLRAGVAFELALAAREMERMGISPRDAAAAAVAGVRNSISREKEKKSEVPGPPDFAGNMAEEAVREFAQKQASKQARDKKDKVLDRVRSQPGGPPEFVQNILSHVRRD
jgi:hypothetical protein